MEPRRRKNIRLRGYDYSEPGEYFVTICTKYRARILGDVVDGAMRLSEAGRIVASCWKEIPAHFPNTRCDVFQIMPNHVHGIIEIRNSVRAQHAAPLQGQQQIKVGRPVPGSLGAIVRSFKSAVTKCIHERGVSRGKIWQRNYYDRIIRTDVEYYFVERYIRLNPLLWHLDSYNPDVRTMPIDQFKRLLKERHNLDDHAIEYLVDCEMNYR